MRTPPHPEPGLAAFRFRLLAFAAAINFVMVVVVGWSQHQNRQHYQQRAETEAQNVSRMLEQTFADMIDRIDFNLKMADAEVSRLRAGEISDATFRDYLRRVQMHFPEMTALRVTDAAGIITHQSDQFPVAGVRTDDRDYFLYLREHRSSGIYVSHPIVSRTTGEAVLLFARRSEDAEGHFSGVVLATINLSQVAWFLSIPDVGAHGVVSLRNREMGIIARHPQVRNGSHVASEKSELPEFQLLAAEERPYGLVTATSPLDGYKRVFAARKVGVYPLYIVVGLAQEDYLAKWHQEVVMALAGLVFIMIASAWLAWLLDRSWRARMAAVAELRRSEARFQALAHLSADWFWRQDEQFRFVEVVGAEGQSGRAFSDWLGRTRWEIGLDKSAEEWQAHRETLEAHLPFHDFEYWIVDRNGRKRCLSSSGEPLFDEAGHFMGYHGVSRDVTERKLYEERIAQMAQYDELTGLPNRALFSDRLNHAISVAKRERREFALLFFDLDRFKPVNDQYGHAAGDQLLQQVSSRLRDLLRESDTVARVGGDEFAVLLPALAGRQDAEDVAQRIIAGLASPFGLEGITEEVMVGVSIGIALYPSNGSDEASLFKSADAAMYQAKREGNRFAFFAEEESGAAPGGNGGGITP